MRLHVLCVIIILTCLTAEIECRRRRRRPRRPNIVFFLADDMGWNDVGYHGMTQIPTPNIDTLAYNSVILNNYYTHPACSPSRTALLSGRYANALGLQHIVLQDLQKVGLPLNIKTLAERMKKLDYKTHMLGKWHQGFYRRAYTPTRRGFDSFLGFWNGDTDHFYHYTPANRTRDRMFGIPCYETRNTIHIEGLTTRCGLDTFNAPGRYLAELYTDEAVRIIKRHRRKKPLFLYLAHHGVHRGNSFLPVRAPKPLTNLFTNINDETRKSFAGALTAIDRSLGDVMEALEQKNMLDDTIVIFSSDNGSPIPTEDQTNGGSNWPLRGVKVTGWEGGVRTNAFVWARLLQNRGTVYNGLMHIVDWMPTLITAAGGNGDEIARRDNLDGMSLWDAIVNSGPSPRTNAVLQNDTIYNLKAYLSGDMKIILPGNLPAPPDPNGYFGDDGRSPPPVGFPITGSKTERVLRKFNDFRTTGTPILLTCGTGTVACDPTQYCLYNVTEDPCEMRNLAQARPEVLQRLQAELEKATANDPPINYPLEDFAANPVYYHGYWDYWADYQFDYNNTSC